VRLGALILPEVPWATARERWTRAEALGLAHGWTYDHLTWRSFRDRAWFGAVPTLAAAASVTGRIALGTLVASPNFRHPLPFVKDLVTLDDISGGRIVAGIGAGGEGWDATVFGRPPWSRRERAERFAEFVELTDLLLRAPAASWRGRYYEVEEARTHPGCVQSPRLPLAIAATGPKGMALAARFGDLWVTTGAPGVGTPLPVPDGVALVASQLARLEEACEARGRDPGGIGRLVLTGPGLDPGLGSVEQFRDTAGRYAEIGVTDLVVHWPRADEPYRADEGVFERAVASTS
jgi:alkanesulfonate monooxygenase SsuD/methylene tetrahydromethanopterin reductase-like flavin-dependent oxidoreductase (luciferase family)